MSKIEYPLTRSTVAESSSLANTMAEVIRKQPNDAFLESASSQLAGKGSEMTTSIATDTGKEKSEIIAQKDDLRDDLFTALKYNIRVHQKWERPELTDMANKLYSIVKKHGLDLYKKNYEEQSALLDSLLEELALPANAQMIELLGMTQLILALTQAHNSFKEEYNASVSIEAAKEEIMAATKIKKEVFVLKKQVVDYLNAMHMAQPEAYNTVFSEVAELVNSLNQKVRNRS